MFFIRHALCPPAEKLIEFNDNQTQTGEFYI